MENIFAWLITVISGGSGAVIYWLWNKWNEDTRQASDDKAEALKERVSVIGAEIKSRLSSLEIRFQDFESTLVEFKKETQFALKSQRDHMHDIYRGVEAVIKKADAVNKETADRVRVIEDKVNTFMEWLKKHG